ncbi:acylsugar acyltransferase 3-like [Solanum tuberosum]|uniref:Acyltransferase n=1 Tax=Solanum tuberosum TaxID=4113 RepID=M1AEJ9_SOLTU|nr:PREDICTED: acylsugar acyltransferase 3-like [Solanum tuberosum]
MVPSLVSLISKKIIKPSILTPPKKSHKLSFVDQVVHMSISMAFFYPKISNYEPTHVSQLLEKSLSITLSLYYPYAGRLNKDDDNYVDCNDMGVDLSHVHVHCPMSQIFRQPYTHAEHVVFPVDDQTYAHNEGKLATMQYQLSSLKNQLNALKANIAHESKVQNPTRSEVVSSLLYKCAIDARKVNNSGSFKPSYLFQLANMRQRLNPPLSHDACGNILSGYFVEIDNDRDVNCSKLVREMRKGKLNLHAKKNVIISEVIESIEKGNTPFHSNEIDNYFCSSLIAFPLYKVDFGWGMGTGPFNKWFYLLDNQSAGGVEVIVMLDEQDMAIFERDPELLEFASPITSLQL